MQPSPAAGTDVQTACERPPEKKARVSSGSPTASPICRATDMPDGGGANYGLGKHEQDFLTPGGRGVIVDPTGGRAADAAVGARRKPRAGSCPSAATTTRPRTASSPASRGRCTSPRRCRSSSRPATSSSCTSACRGAAIPLDGRAASARPHASLAGRFGRQVGRRHAGRRDHEFQRQDVAERGGRDRQPRPARGRAVHADRRRYASTTRRQCPIRSSTRGRGRSRSR